MTNLEFLRRHGKAGRVGLVGGTLAIDRAIRFAQRKITPDRGRSLWSHAFLFQGDRIDGEAWVLESDLDFRRGSFRNGVQENRIHKYADADAWPNVAVLDFGLTDAEARRVVGSGLDFVSGGTSYSIGGIFKTYLAILRKTMSKERPQKDENFCSSFVRTLFRLADRDLAPGVALRHTTPEHLAQSPLDHQRHEIIRHR